VRPKIRLPKHLPAGTKYVVESCGEFVRRFVELPNGKKIRLPNRKAHTCGCTERISIVPEQATDAGWCFSDANLAKTFAGRFKMLASGHEPNAGKNKQSVEPPEKSSE
jgi:hypothetical protein